MNESTEKAKQLLLESGSTFVLVNSDRVFRSNGRAVATLVQLLKEDSLLLRDSCIADRVVGKAAAMMMHYGGIKEVYGNIISEPAAAYFEKHGVSFYFRQKVPNILNRDRSGLCPMEKLCLGIDSSQVAYKEIENFMSNSK